jgi:hypothetical protein
MDYKHEAKKILYEHTSAVMHCATMEFESNEAMLDCMIEECGFILTEALLEGKYTPMQYNAIRNELASILWGIFEPHIKKEMENEMAEFVKLFSI